MFFKYLVLVVICGASWCQAALDSRVHRCDDKPQDKLYTCLEITVGSPNPYTVLRDLDTANSTARIDEVFKKYCTKSTELKACLINFVEEIKPCFPERDNNMFHVYMDMMLRLYNFSCSNQGESKRLIAEGGLKCVNKKKEETDKCAESLNFLSLKFDNYECNKLADLKTCAVNELRKCWTPTAANIFESLIKYVQVAIPCEVFTSGAAPGVSIAVATLATAAITAILT